MIASTRRRGRGFGGTVKHGGHDWEWHTEPCVDDPTTHAIWVNHPGNGRDEMVGYTSPRFLFLMADYAEAEAEVLEFAEKECAP